MKRWVFSFSYIAETVSLRITTFAKVYVSLGKMVVMNGTYKVGKETAMHEVV